jgi:hypothetical protein
VSSPSRYRVATGRAAILPTITPIQSPGQVAFGEHQPAIPGVLDQPASRLHQPLLQAGHLDCLLTFFDPLLGKKGLWTIDRLNVE